MGHGADGFIRGAVGIVGKHRTRQVVVRAVAERPRARVFAAAEDDVFVPRGFEENRRETGPGMRAVAERLIGRSSAGAPEIALPRFHLEIEAFGPRDPGLFHGHFHRCLERLSAEVARWTRKGRNFSESLPCQILFSFRHQTGLPSLLAQAAISVFDGRVLSTSLRAVSMPATGSPAGSSLPICTRTEA